MILLFENFNVNINEPLPEYLERVFNEFVNELGGNIRNFLYTIYAVGERGKKLERANEEIKSNILKKITTSSDSEVIALLNVYSELHNDYYNKHYYKLDRFIVIPIIKDILKIVIEQDRFNLYVRIIELLSKHYDDNITSFIYDVIIKSNISDKDKYFEVLKNSGLRIYSKLRSILYKKVEPRQYKRIKEYKDIIKLGLVDVTTKRQQKNGTLQFDAPNDISYMIYSDGTIRRKTSGMFSANIGIVKRTNINITSIKDLKRVLRIFISYYTKVLLKNIVSDVKHLMSKELKTKISKIKDLTFEEFVNILNEVLNETVVNNHGYIKILDYIPSNLIYSEDVKTKLLCNSVISFIHLLDETSTINHAINFLLSKFNSNINNELDCITNINDFFDFLFSDKIIDNDVITINDIVIIYRILLSKIQSYKIILDILNKFNLEKISSLNNFKIKVRIYGSNDYNNKHNGVTVTKNDIVINDIINNKEFFDSLPIQVKKKLYNALINKQYCDFYNDLLDYIVNNNAKLLKNVDFINLIEFSCINKDYVIIMNLLL